MSTEFLQPTTLAEAAALLAEYGDEARLLAGGTAVVPQLTQRAITPAVLISLGRVSGLNFIRRDSQGLHLGALTPLSRVAGSQVVHGFCPALAKSYGVVANVRVRNQATVGGSLAAREHDSDPPTMLRALEARLKLKSHGKEREISIEEFLTGAREGVLTEVIVPPLAPSARSVFWRETKRSAEARPSVNIAVVADFQSDGRCRTLRLVVGASVATPQRLPQIEAQGSDVVLTDALIRHIAAEYANSLELVEEPLESVWYRRELMQVVARRALEEVLDGSR